MTSVKICGLTDARSVQSVIDAKAEYTGFVYFPKSPRHIALHEAAILKTLLPETTQSVSVLVDPDNALLAEVRKILAPDFIQLHGQETPERVQEIKNNWPHVRIIKAIKVRTSDDIANAGHYYHCADMLMFDAKPPELSSLPGGNGLSFDWALLKDREFPLPWILSGGLTGDNVVQAIKQTGAKIVDVSSGVEQKPGVKDPTLIQAFVKAAKNV